MNDYSYVGNAEAKYIEALYETYQLNPSEIDNSWSKFFEGFEYALGAEGASVSSNQVAKELRVYSLIEGYRKRGHLLSTTNPIRPRKNRKPHLELSEKGFSDEDLNTHFMAGSVLGLENPTLSEILNRLKEVYVGNIGIEFKHITNYDEVEWIRDKFESRKLDYDFSLEKKKGILNKLNQSVVFEKFLGTKYVGQKRFSLEGGENTIPALDAIIHKSSELGADEVVIGMAHRGRLNVLANTLGKTYDYIFGEFEGNIDTDVPMGDGDVKYHLGFSSQVQTKSGRAMNLHLAPNPSHLEAVNPVVLGYSRAKQDALHKGQEDKVVPVLIHGDSAVAGQGVVYEIVQMSKLDGYHTGGTIHFVINNQVGFTTNFEDARSSTYSTSIGNIVEAPILHVNGDDAEAVVYAAEFATEYRQKFHKDVWVDMVCYRRHGHNESDEPRFTQPSFYALISKHPNPRKIYSDLLISRGQIEAELARSMEKEFKELLQDRLNEVKQTSLPYKVQPLEMEWYNVIKDSKNNISAINTGASKNAIDAAMKALLFVPDNIKPISKVTKLLEDRKYKYDSDELDWALGELLAYGTLLQEGYNVRLSGQDVVRGTFSHRHAAVFDQKTDVYHNSLNHINDKQGNLRIFNSHLSEFGVLGFEYGYSMVSPNNLVIWEAQFGDFANGAQVMIDQFITSAESKWQRYSGMVLMLPHGYEGEGPEHSNARPERYLQLAAEENIFVANCTTPANYFHLLRRQIVGEFRKPLVVFTPKSLLRHPKVISSKEELINGSFQELIIDKAGTKVNKVLMCTGKVYYDLLEYKEANKLNNTVLVRVEQIYPFPEQQVIELRKKYPKATFKWVQEEPKNMGAYTFLLRYDVNRDLELVARKASASPATGFKKTHFKEQKELIEKAFA
ncbi:MAG: 2-oxoglutarate dehydrogenase E1 component [Bacteroidetes bacterium]|nr:2-oxoglutarate dehydrogenase E1 component [Bacteroidota bacterium]